MAQITIYECDRCHDHISEYRYKLIAERTGEGTAPITVNISEKTGQQDLCEKCFNEVIKLLTPKETSKEEKTIDKAVAKTKSKQKEDKITDKGKFFALWRAKRPNEFIATEFGIMPEEVIYYKGSLLTEYKKEFIPRLGRWAEKPTKNEL